MLYGEYHHRIYRKIESGHKLSGAVQYAIDQACCTAPFLCRARKCCFCTVLRLTKRKL